jgi:hypothetical protein
MKAPVERILLLRVHVRVSARRKKFVAEGLNPAGLNTSARLAFRGRLCSTLWAALAMAMR